jgi:hypothetical protein
VAVLFRAKPPGILDDFPNPAACVARGEVRPPSSALSPVFMRAADSP